MSIFLLDELFVILLFLVTLASPSLFSTVASHFVSLIHNLRFMFISDRWKHDFLMPIV